MKQTVYFFVSCSSSGCLCVRLSLGSLVQGLAARVGAACKVLGSERLKELMPEIPPMTPDDERSLKAANEWAWKEADKKYVNEDAILPPLATATTTATTTPMATTTATTTPLATTTASTV